MTEELTIKSAIDFAIKTERQGAKLYNWMAKLFSTNAELRDAFSALAKDEVSHGERFTALLEGLPTSLPPASPEQEEYLRALFHSELFFLFRNIEKIQDRDDALERALHLEKSTLLCYQAMHELLGAHPALEEIIAEEKRHVVQIMKYLVTGARMRGLGDEHP